MMSSVQPDTSSPTQTALSRPSTLILSKATTTEALLEGKGHPADQVQNKKGRKRNKGNYKKLFFTRRNKEREKSQNSSNQSQQQW